MYTAHRCNMHIALRRARMPVSWGILALGYTSRVGLVPGVLAKSNSAMLMSICFLGSVLVTERLGWRL